MKIPPLRSLWIPLSLICVALSVGFIIWLDDAGQATAGPGPKPVQRRPHTISDTAAHPAESATRPDSSGTEAQASGDSKASRNSPVSPSEALREVFYNPLLSAKEKADTLGYLSLSLPRNQTTADAIALLPDQSLTGSALGTTVSYWSDKYPEAAAAWVAKHLDNPHQERLARGVVQQWVKKDLAAAAHWVLTLPEGVAKETGTIYVAQAMVPVNPEIGMKWVEQIKHPKWREVLTEQAQQLLSQKATAPETAPGQ